MSFTRVFRAMPYSEQHLGTTRQKTAVTKFISSSLVKTTVQNQHTHAAPLARRQSLDVEKSSEMSQFQESLVSLTLTFHQNPESSAHVKFVLKM